MINNLASCHTLRYSVSPICATEGEAWWQTQLTAHDTTDQSPLVESWWLDIPQAKIWIHRQDSPPIPTSRALTKADTQQILRIFSAWKRWTLNGISRELIPEILNRFTYMVEVPMLDSPGGISCDDNELDALFKAVGFVVVQWGQAEQSLDLTTAILYQDLEGRPLVKRLPKMLETKLEFVEKCLAKMPSLASVRADGEVLVADFRTLSAKRHDLIHGAIASVSATDGGFAFMKLDIQGDRHVVREFRFEGAEYPKLTKDLIDLGARATTFARKLWDLRKV